MILLFRKFAVLLLSLLSTGALAQTSEDAQMQHMGRLADTALKRAIPSHDGAGRQKQSNANLKDGSSKPDGRPTHYAALLAAERAWLAYRDAHCETVGLAHRGGAYKDEADGKCVNEIDRKLTVELKALMDSMNQEPGRRWKCPLMS